MGKYWLIALFVVGFPFEIQAQGIPYQTPARGGVLFQTAGQAPEVTAGYARLRTAAGQTLPSALAIFGLRQNNVLVAEAAVPGVRAVTSGRIFAEVGGAVNTGIAIANPNSLPTTVNFFFTDSNGTNVGTGSMVVPTNGQFAGFLSDPPFNMSSIAGTFTFTSTQPIGVIALRGYRNERADFLMTTLPVIELTPRASTLSIFPHFADGSGWTTQMAFVNPTDTTISGSVQFFDQGTAGPAAPISLTVNGQTGTTFTYSIPPRSARSLLTSGSGSVVRVGSIRVLPAGGTSAPVGVAIFGYRAGGVRVTESGVPEAPAGTAFRLYVEATTGMAIANNAGAATNITFDLYGMDGAFLATASLPLAANAQRSFFPSDITGLPSLPPTFQGILRIRSTSPISVIGLRVRTNERGDFLIATTPPRDESAPPVTGDLFLPHLVDGAGFSTQVVFVGSPSSGENGSLTFYNQAGQTTELVTAPQPTPPTVAVTITGSPARLSLLPGQQANISTSVALATVSTQSQTAQLSQTLSSSGILISPSITPSFSATGDFSFVANQTITALTLGTHTVTTVATVDGQSGSSTGSVIVDVVSTLHPLTLNAPATSPAVLPPSVSTNVLFSVIVEGGNSASPPILQIEDTSSSFVLALNDNGLAGDLKLGDLVYSGQIMVNAAGKLPGDCLSYRARSGSTLSPTYQLCVSSFPPVPAPSNFALSFPNDSGGQTIANEVLVVFKDGVTEAQVRQAADTVSATVVGSVPQLKMYQLRFAAALDLAALTARINQLKTLPFVQDAVANDLGASDAVTPSDTSFAQQYGMVKIRADEAWTIARGEAVIAIIDSGVDYTHPDLSAKVIKGPDYANGDDDPFDDLGHGTHVAGIAAASSNNSSGVAGVAWNSPILAVKVLKASGSPGFPGSLGSAIAVAQGIVYSANQGVRVMNMSLGSYSATWQLIVCPAVAYARFVRGVTVVATAGNNGVTTPRYPAACPGAIAVGSTDSSDGKSSFSNSGTWVDIAAPGSGIYSTVPTGTCSLCDSSGYKTLDGTSMAAPHVAGAVAVLLSRQPTLTASEIENRLKKTAFALPKELQIGDRLDLFEAVFNGSFEDDSMAFWTVAGTVNSLDRLGAILPPLGKRMAYLSSGPSGDQVSATMEQQFTVQSGVSTIPIRFQYAFLSEEYPEFVGTEFNDSMTISLRTPGGLTIKLAEETINAGSFVPLGGIDFPDGDDTVGWTGWKTVTVNVPVTSGAGSYTVLITDAGDDIYDSVVLIDGIRMK